MYADVVVGADAYDVGQEPSAGAAFVYLGSAPIAQPALVPSLSPAGGALLGGLLLWLARRGLARPRAWAR